MKIKWLNMKIKKLNVKIKKLNLICINSNLNTKSVLSKISSTDKRTAQKPKRSDIQRDSYILREKTNKTESDKCRISTRAFGTLKFSENSKISRPGRPLIRLFVERNDKAKILRSAFNFRRTFYCAYGNFEAYTLYFGAHK